MFKKRPLLVEIEREIDLFVCLFFFSDDLIDDVAEETFSVDDEEENGKENKILTEIGENHNE